MEMTDNDSKHLSGAWQNTPTRPDDSIVDPSMPSSDKSTTSISHVPSTELRQHDIYNITDVTPTIRRIRQLREKALLDKRGTSPRDERHKESEERLASLEKEEQDALHRKEREKQTAHSNKLGPTSTTVRIVRKISPLTYKVAFPAGSKIHDVVSIIHLKKYGSDTGDVRPLPIEQEGQPEWEC